MQVARQNSGSRQVKDRRRFNGLREPDDAAGLGQMPQADEVRAGISRSVALNGRARGDLTSTL